MGMEMMYNIEEVKSMKQIIPWVVLLLCVGCTSIMLQTKDVDFRWTSTKKVSASIYESESEYRFDIHTDPSNEHETIRAILGSLPSKMY
jgi:hypothetical protein